jgi:hypothetical protein
MSKPNGKLEEPSTPVIEYLPIDTAVIQKSLAKYNKCKPHP